MSADAGTEAVRFEGASLRIGGRPIWNDLSLTVGRGEFLAVLGPNGAGKTSLLRVLLGVQPVWGGIAMVWGKPPRPGRSAIGYVPQQTGFDRDLPVRGRDLVAWGLDGQRWGLGLTRGATWRRVDAILDLVGARAYADAPIGLLSGGEQQRIRIAQALVADPRLLLCDEPLLSLDLHFQHRIVELIADWSRRGNATVLFVTHDINPILSVVDRVLLLAGARWTVGAPSDVLTAETLTRVYGTQVDVLHHGGRIVILGADLGSHESLRDHSPVRE